MRRIIPHETKVKALIEYLYDPETTTADLRRKYGVHISNLARDSKVLEGVTKETGLSESQINLMYEERKRDNIQRVRKMGAYF